MWVGAQIPRLGTLLPKNWATYLLAALFAAFLCTLGFSPASHAADASWQSDGIHYGDKVYKGPQKVVNASNSLGLAKGVTYYIDDSQDGKRNIIFFNGDDIANATNAQYAEYNFTPPDQFFPQGPPRQITIDKQPANAANPTRDEEKTSCAINGVGFWLCPLMQSIADGMDHAYNVVKGFMYVRPLSTDRDSPLHRAWSYMAAIANIAFILAFLVFIYSYLTSQGVSNYEIKRMVPRLVIAAILVNVSYYICAALVDVSNIAGASLQQVFEDIRNHLGAGFGNAHIEISASKITAYVLSAGTLGIAGFAFVSGAGAASVLSLVSVLVPALIAIIVVLAILAARQALIIVLVVISPLAFVAYVLPNTEKYFEKWRGTFQTMLLLYPIFSILFGGSQLAAFLIMQNATSIEMVILALFVQVAPLVVTPFLIKFSGSLLGRLAGMINNPTKGIGDKAKNWAQRKQELAGERRRANKSFGSGFSRWLERGQRIDEERKAIYQQRRKRNFAESRVGQSLALQKMQEDELMSQADNINKAAWAEAKRTNPHLRVQAVNVKIAEMNMEVREAEMKQYLEDLRSEKHAKHYIDRGDIAAQSLSKRVRELSHQEHAVANATQFAQIEDRLQYATDMLKNNDPKADELQDMASGAAGTKGRALAAGYALNTMIEDWGKSSKVMGTAQDYFKLTGAETTQLATGNGGVMKVSKDGKYKFDFEDGNEYARDAAVERVIGKKGSWDDKLKVYSQSGTPEYADYLGTIFSSMPDGMIQKAPWLGGKNYDYLTDGKIKTIDDYKKVVRETVAAGKFKAEWLYSADTGALRSVFDIVMDGNLDGVANEADYMAAVEELKAQAADAIDNDNNKSRVTTSSRKAMEEFLGRRLDLR
jgi:hypothetical protein